ncbi:DUF4383 domain-containing protein [Modestobacter sp. URMC 112]
MSVRSHFRPHPSRPHDVPRGAAGPEHRDADPPGPGRSAGSRVFLVQRTGALVVAVFLLLFGVLGFAGGLDFFATDGERVLGLSSNGLLSALSVVVGAVLFGAALLGPRVASTVMMVVGSLFLLSALVNLAVLRTSFNVLAFEMRNVLFSIGVGLVLLVLGAYGRVSGNLPDDSPYAHPATGPEVPPESYPSTPEEFAAEAAMREAELAVAEHRATEDQRRRVQAMAAVHTRAERRRVWTSSELPPAPPSPAPHRSALSRAVGSLRARRGGDRRPVGK